MEFSKVLNLNWEFTTSLGVTWKTNFVSFRLLWIAKLISSNFFITPGKCVVRDTLLTCLLPLHSQSRGREQEHPPCLLIYASMVLVCWLRYYPLPPTRLPVDWLWLWTGSSTTPGSLPSEIQLWMFYFSFRLSLLDRLRLVKTLLKKKTCDTTYVDL